MPSATFWAAAANGRWPRRSAPGGSTLPNTHRCPTPRRAISHGSSTTPGLSGNLYRCCAGESTRWLSAEPELARTMSTPDSEPVVLTVGHSTRPLAEFITLLKAHSVARLIDVRTVPRSRHNPQFDRETLPAAAPGQWGAPAAAGACRRAVR